MKSTTSRRSDSLPTASTVEEQRLFPDTVNSFHVNQFQLATVDAELIGCKLELSSPAFSTDCENNRLELAEKRLDAQGVSTPVQPAQLQDLKRQLSVSSESDPWTRWGKWLMGSPTPQPDSPR